MIVKTAHLLYRRYTKGWGFLQFRVAESAGEGVGASASKLVLTATDRPSRGAFFCSSA